MILCLRKFGQKTYCLHAPRDSEKHNHAARLFVGTYRKFAPVCGNISKTQVSNEETYLKESRRQTRNCRFLYIDKVQSVSQFIIFSSSKLPTCFVSKNNSLFITTIIIAAITTKIVCIHFVSGVMFIFSCIIFINK